MKQDLKEFNKAPGRQWILVIWNQNMVGYILDQKRYPSEITYGLTLGPSAKVFETQHEAYQFAKMAKLDKNWNFAVTDFVQEMKNMIRTGNMKFMVDEYYVRIICENKAGEKFYIKHDKSTDRLYPDKDWRNTFIQTESNAKIVIEEISKQKEDKYINYKTEKL